MAKFNMVDFQRRARSIYGKTINKHQEAITYVIEVAGRETTVHGKDYLRNNKRNINEDMQR